MSTRPSAEELAAAEIARIDAQIAQYDAAQLDALYAQIDATTAISENILSGNF
jgi:hypothetical protein